MRAVFSLADGTIGHPEPLTDRTFVEALARAAGVEPTFVSVSREAIQDAGGHLFMEPLGQMLDIPPYTSVVEKAARVLGLTPTSLENALAEGFQWDLAQPRRPLDYAFEDGLIAEA